MGQTAEMHSRSAPDIAAGGAKRPGRQQKRARGDASSSAAPQSVTRVLQILDALSAADHPVSLADLSRSLGSPKSSLAALLRGLVDTNFAVLSDGAYRLGPGAFGLGSALVEARRRLQTSDIIRDGMRDLSASSGETVLFAVLDDAAASTLTYVDMIESRNAIRFAVAVGDRRPLYCTSGGRALLSAKTDEQVSRYLETAKLRRLTARTEIDRAKLLELVRRARAEQFARTNGEMEDGVSGIAALIRDARTVLGALVLAAPTSRLEAHGSKLVSLVREAAKTISSNLGYRNLAGAT